MRGDAGTASTPDDLGQAERHYWRHQARRLDWRSPFTQVCRTVDGGPRRHWFADGLTNLCHNAIDRHLSHRAERTALIHVDAEDRERRFSYRDLHREVQVMAAILQSFDIAPGDRVAIHLPMIPQALIAMLACARIGAIHVVIFAGLPAAEIAARLDAVCPRLLISADGGLDGSHWRHYRPLLRQALARYRLPLAVVMIDRGRDGNDAPLPREFAYATLCRRFAGARVACSWMPSQAPSHILHTSGTNGRPKGVVRDTGGYGVALATSLETVYEATDGDIVFTSADIGWVVGHSYLVYAPLLNGLTSVMMEGGPCHTHPARWWRAIERLGITHLLAAPTAIRKLRQTRVVPSRDAELGSLRRVFLAGEPLDASSAAWLRSHTSAHVIDHYWQTESGWPVLAGDSRTGTLSPVSHRRVAIVDDRGNPRRHPDIPGSIVVEGHLSPGGMLTLWQHDDLHDALYWSRWQRSWRYDTHDWGSLDGHGRLRVLGRTDDVINVGGKRLSTVDIEQIVLQEPSIAEVAAVGVPHPLLGQIAVVYVVLGETCQVDAATALASRLRAEIVAGLGRHACPRRVIVVDALPRTRSGKIQRKRIDTGGQRTRPRDSSLPC